MRFSRSMLEESDPADALFDSDRRRTADHDGATRPPSTTGGAPGTRSMRTVTPRFSSIFLMNSALCSISEVSDARFGMERNCTNSRNDFFFMGNTIGTHLFLNAGTRLSCRPPDTNYIEYRSNHNTRDMTHGERRYHRTSAVEPETLTQVSARPLRYLARKSSTRPKKSRLFSGRANPCPSSE
jgi:hypothetical protein